MSLNLPQPAAQPDWWSRFSADPRTMGATRASDADRDVAVRAINEAFAEGRLDRAEHAERLSGALEVRQLGELVPLLRDVVPTNRVAHAGVSAGASLLSNTMIRRWVALAVLFNLIWLMTGGPAHYYWPMWPMLGTAIPFGILWAVHGNADNARASRAARTDRRAARLRAAEAERRARLDAKLARRRARRQGRYPAPQALPATPQVGSDQQWPVDPRADGELR